MNRIRLFGLLAAMALALPLGAGAATQLSADGGEIRDIKFATGAGAAATLYAASQGGGVFKSTNSGQTWSATALVGVYAWSLAVSPLNVNRVYVATDQGLFRTSDGGANWNQLTFDPARAVAINPGSAGNDTVLLGVTGIGILRSTDSGASFARQSSGLDSTDVTRIVYGQADLAYVLLNCNVDDGVAPLAEGNWGGVFRATNANAAAATINWVDYNNGGAGGALPSKCVRGLDASGTTVYAGVQDPFTGGGSVYKSTGAGWDAGNNLFGIESIAIDRTTANTIHLGTRGIGPWASTNAGTSYGQKSDPTRACPTTATPCPDVWTRIYAMESIPGTNTVLIAAKGIGIQRTTVYNTNPVGQAGYWTAATGLAADRVRALTNHAASNPTRFWMALENGGVAISLNSGSTWAPINAGFDFGNFPSDSLANITALGADPNTGTVVAGMRGGGLLQYNGSQWTVAGLAASVTNTGTGHDFKPQQIFFPATGQMYVTFFDGVSAKAGGLLRSTAGPGSLTQTVYPNDLTSCSPAPSTAAVTGSAYKVVQAAGSVAYLLRYDAPPYRSTNNFADNSAACGAGSFNAPHTGYERIMFHDIAQKPSNTAILVGATSKGVFRSTDSGVNWARLDISGLQSQVLAAVAYANNILYGIERAGRLYCSSNDGATWSTVSLAPLQSVPFRDLRVFGNTLYILTDGGGLYTGFAASCP